MSISRLIRDRAPLHIDWRRAEHCFVCGFYGHPYRSTRYGENTDHCLRCHSHRRKRNLARAVVVAMAAAAPRGRLLEIAPGGQLSSKLRRDYRGYIGLRYPPYDAAEIPLQDGSVDVVVSCDVIEHFNDPRAAMREINRVLVPGGRHLSAVLTDQHETIYRQGEVLDYHQDEDGAKCSVYTLLGHDLPCAVSGWLGFPVDMPYLNGGVLCVTKAKEE